MKLYGHAIPLDDGGYVVTVICPNEGSKGRLMVELSRIEADAFAPEIALRDGEPTATGGGMATHHVEPNQATLSAIAESYAGNVELSPSVEALIALGDEDAPLAGLKAGEAYREEEE